MRLQVYRGKLRPEWGGKEVAVKVQRPGALESVSLDIFIMRRAVTLFSQVCGGGSGSGLRRKRCACRK